MRAYRIFFLLQILAFSLMFIKPICVTSLGTCDCYGPDYPSEADIQQFNWYKEAYCFLYGGDGCCYASKPYDYWAPAFNQTTGEGSAKYWLGKADRFYLEGSYEQAVSSYANALELDPSLSEGWLNMGNALFFLSRHQESLNAYDAVLQRDPQNPNALQGKGQALQALNHTDEASAVLEMARVLQGRKILVLGSYR